jgi:hypothetical protein
MEVRNLIETESSRVVRVEEIRKTENFDWNMCWKEAALKT